MILMDTPRPGRFPFRAHPKNRRKPSDETTMCHVISTLPGEGGTAELLAFAERCGLKERWIMERGTSKEHFDLFGGAISRAEQAGAVLADRHHFVTAIKDKRRGVDNGP